MLQRRFTTFRLPVLPLLAAVLMTHLVAAGAPAQGWICAQGGGSPATDAWARPAFEWMIRHGRPGTPEWEAGDRAIRVVILGTVEDGTTPPTEAQLAEAGDETAARFVSAGAAAVRQIYLNTGNSGDPETIKAIREAHIIWMRDGLSSSYLRVLKGSAAESAIRAVFARGGVVGGSGAGCAMLGEFVPDAAGTPCDTSAALRDPFDSRIAFGEGSLRLLPGSVIDTRLTERARIGRLGVFVARLRVAHGRDVLGIGIDADTALCISPQGVAEVFGTGVVCLMHLDPQSRLTISPAQGEWPTPPAVTDIRVGQLISGQTVNLRGLIEPLAAAGRLEGPDAGRVAPVEYKREVDRTDARFVRGDATAHAERGRFFIPGTLPTDALLNGTLTLGNGTGEIAGAVLAARTLALKERTQNAAGGVLWALATTDARWGTFLDMGAALRLLDDGLVQSYLPHGKLGAAMSAPIFYKSAAFKAGPRPAGARQSCAFDGLTMHILPAGWTFDPSTGAAGPPAPTPIGTEAVPAARP